MALEEGKDSLGSWSELGRSLEETEKTEEKEEKEEKSSATSPTTEEEGEDVNETEESSSPSVPARIPFSVISDFLSACGSLDVKKIREALDSREGKGLDPNLLRDKLGQNGFHYTICSPLLSKSKNRLSSILKYLSKKGLNVNQTRDSDGWTPIYLAVTFGLHQVVVWLLSKGAKINIKDNEQQSPEDIASKFRMHKIKDTLIHHRSKVPHSRFSCVLSGPALSSPPSSATSSSDPIPSDNTSISSTSSKDSEVVPAENALLKT